MTFLDTSSLWHLLWIVPLFITLWCVGAHRAKHKMAMIFPDREQARHFIDLSPAKRNLRILLFACAVLCTLIAVARPTWGKQIVPETSAGRDLLVVFDVSRSMLADDVKPTRLAHAKWVVRELVKQNPGDRFGLIAFAGTAFLSCPLTADRTSFTQLVDELDTNTIPLGGTNVQKALETAVKAFAGAEGTHKAVVLITDGDELEGRGASVITDLRNAGIPLIIAGIGDPSVPSIIRVTDENGQAHILTDSDGNAVKSPLNEEQLGALARSTNGIYVRSTATEAGIEHLEARIRMLDRKENKDELGMFRPIERPVYPIAGALLFLLLFFCIPETRKIAVTLFASLFCIHIYAQNTARPASDPSEPSAEEKVRTSEVTDAKPDEQKKPLTAIDLFNRGLADQTEKHDNESARTNYELSISLAQKEPAARASSYQNIGVLAHNDAREDVQKAMESVQNQKLDEAKKNVEQALVKLNQAEEHYCESMRSVDTSANPGILRNQQILLQDRKSAEELKAKIEELQKLQQQAAQQTQQALDQQQQENQQQDSKNPEDKQNQQENQSQNQQQDTQNQENKQNRQQDSKNPEDKQNQQQDTQNQENKQNQQQSQQQKSAEERTQEAKNSAEDLEQKASDMKQDNLQQAAKQAKQELEQAQEAQSKGDGKSAEEHLQNALNSLKPENQNENNQESDSEQAQGDEGESKEQEQQNQPKENDAQKNAQPQQAEAEQKNQPIDKQQAEAILNSMTNDEKDARDQMRLQQRNSSFGRVEKDW